MLRLHLPPNLAAAAGRDAVALRVEFEPGSPITPALAPVLALLQRWCAAPTPPAFIQLRRSQLRELANAAGELPIFVENGQSAAWRHAALVAENNSSAPAIPPTPPSPAAVRRARTPAHATPMSVDGSEHFLAISLPSREHPRYADALALVKESGLVLEPSNRKWWLRDRHKVLNFLATHRASLARIFEAEFTPNFQRNTAHLADADVTAEATPTGDGFAVTVGLRAGSADEAAIRSAVALNRHYVEAGGRIFLLDATGLARLEAAQRALAGDPSAGFSARRTHHVSRAQVAAAHELLEALSPNFQPPETWRTRSAAMRNLSALPPAPLPPALAAQLRPYQQLGSAWLWHLYREELGGVLADEMGLGKTLQAIALLCAIKLRVESPELRAPEPDEYRSTPSPNPQPSTLNSAPPLTPQRSTLNPRRVSLVVAPASLLENWRREAARFGPQLNVFVHHADVRVASGAAFAAHDVVITSYGTLARDQTLFSDFGFECVIADEAQHIKNRRSQNAAALRSLRARARFVLTGTPLENSLDDLRSLFEFLLPGYLTTVPAGTRGEDRTWFDDRLRAQTAPYILRRTKRAVAPELPARLEQVIWCEFAPAQARLYRETQESSERELLALAAGGASESRLKFAALTQLLRLRQICCDPRLLPNSEPQTPNPDPPGFSDSAKLEAFRELVAEAVDDGHRLLVFSQFTTLLALLRADLDAQGLASCYLDGSMTARERQAQVDRFQSSLEIPLFLLSLKAGGTGLNLTGADTVVHFDPWWNPAAEAQATDRAHRIGQTRTVTSYRLIVAGTVEEKVLALQAEKRALLAGVFEASDAVSAQLTLGDLKALMRHQPGSAGVPPA